MLFFVSRNRCLNFVIQQAGIRNKKKADLLENLCNLLPQPVLEHSWRVSDGCRKIAKLHNMNLCHDELDFLSSAGCFHDIGKLFINGAILGKPGRLSPAEYAIVKHHTYIGHAILSTMGAGKDVAEALLYHHENADGSGYPKGISGSQIPVLARLIHVMDVYDALTSDRPYRPAYTPSKAVEIMQSEHANFDPVVLDVLINLIRRDQLGQLSCRCLSL